MYNFIMGRLKDNQFKTNNKNQKDENRSIHYMDHNMDPNRLVKERK